MIRFRACFACGLLLALAVGLYGKEPNLRAATFDVDATPPIGSPVAYAAARKIVDPLHARGIVLLPAGQQPIVLCCVDWIGIANGGQDEWHRQLAKAAGTSPQRVAVHTVHQHDGPRCDFDAVALFAEPQQAQPHFDVRFSHQVIERTAAAIRSSLGKTQPVTHIGAGRAKVEKVASNRRLLGPDGKVEMMRFSSCTNPKAIAAPEGVIDPYLRLVSFWNHDQPLACLAYYATHPMSHYGKGDVSADFPGLARADRDKALGILHVYFTGAGGNVAAGKYNDGSPERRPELAHRMADAMRRAWEATVKTPIAASDVQWRVEPVQLPVAKHLDIAKLRSTLSAADTADKDRLAAASNLAWAERCEAGRKIDLTCLRLGSVYLVHMPGELFVEYQLAAAALRPSDTVCMAAYGDYGPGYIGTQLAYGQGGYETSARASRVAPEVEPVLKSALKRLLK